MTIASYNIWKSWLQAALVAIIFFSVPVGTVWLFINGYFDTVPRLGRGFYFLPFIFLAWFLTWRDAPKLFRLFKHLVLDGGRSVWVQDGRLFVAGVDSFSLPCSDVTDIQAGVSKKSNYDIVILRLKSGNKEEFATGSFQESSDVVIEKLRRALGLRTS